MKVWSPNLWTAVISLWVDTFLVYLFFLVALGLCCCAPAVSSYSECELLSRCSVGFSCCRAQALGAQASVAAAHRLSSCGTWAQQLQLWALEHRLSSCGIWV